MMQDYSTAHMFLYKCTEQLVRIHSSHVSGLKLVTEWFLTHSLKDLLLYLIQIHRQQVTLMLTHTTEELELLTLCNIVLHTPTRDPKGSLFLSRYKLVGISFCNFVAVNTVLICLHNSRIGGKKMQPNLLHYGVQIGAQVCII